MKVISPILAVACLGALNANAALMVDPFIPIAFHDFDDAATGEDPDHTYPGWSGSISEGIVSEESGGSSDNTYGDHLFSGSSVPHYNVLPGSPTVSQTQDGHVKVQDTAPLTITMTNGSGAGVLLTHLLFDAAYKNSAASILTVDWSTSGGASGSADFQPSHQQTVWDGPGNYSDMALDLMLTPLGDLETITFTFSTLVGGGETFRIDNIALAAIPETTGVMALAGLMLSGVFFRRRPVQAAAATA